NGQVDHQRVDAHRDHFLGAGRRLEPAVLPAEIVGPLREYAHEARVGVEDRDPKAARVSHVPACGPGLEWAAPCGASGPIRAPVYATKGPNPPVLQLLHSPSTPK